MWKTCFWPLFVSVGIILFVINVMSLFLIGSHSGWFMVIHNPRRSQIPWQRSQFVLGRCQIESTHNTYNYLNCVLKNKQNPGSVHAGSIHFVHIIHIYYIKHYKAKLFIIASRAPSPSRFRIQHQETETAGCSPSKRHKAHPWQRSED